MANVQLHFIIDPLCGWCYAASPALAAVAARYPEALQLTLSGLFSDAGARAISPSWAEHAWSNDQRIAAMTGLAFSEAYHQKILLGNGTRFDSGPINRALTAVHALDPVLETGLLQRLQVARYIEAQDTGLASVVAEITAQFVLGTEHKLKPQAFAEVLVNDAGLAQQTLERTQEGQRLMQRVGAQGVPLLVVRRDDEWIPVNANLLFQEPDALLQLIQRLA